MTRPLEPSPLRRRDVLARGACLLGAGSGALIAVTDAAQAQPAVVAREASAPPEFTGIEQWFNSPPLTLAGLRGQVVLVNFWTFGCVNCINTLPHVNRWVATYKDAGFTLVGVHTPEFAWERPAASVKTAMQRLGVKHPVAQDNTWATWRAWSNQYWPAFYLIDAQGRRHYQHFGEGRYEQMDANIRSLLAARDGKR